MTERIKRLKEAVEHEHGCTAVHVSSESISETYQGQTMWEGVVETFNIDGHPRAARCHAWSYDLGGETHHTTVLELPPVTSARSAVQSVIAAHSRSGMERGTCERCGSVELLWDGVCPDCLR